VNAAAPTRRSDLGGAPIKPGARHILSLVLVDRHAPVQNHGGEREIRRHDRIWPGSSVWPRLPVREEERKSRRYTWATAGAKSGSLMAICRRS
jgi:hypothetical protein